MRPKQTKGFAQLIVGRGAKGGDIVRFVCGGFAQLIVGRGAKVGDA